MLRPWVKVRGGPCRRERWGAIQFRFSMALLLAVARGPPAIAWKTECLFQQTPGAAWDFLLPSCSGHQFLIFVTRRQDDM